MIVRDHAPENARRAAARHSMIIIGWHRNGTGLSRTLQSTFRHLTPHWRIDVAGIGCEEPTRDVDGLRVHPTNLDGADVLGSYKAIELLPAVQPDVLLCFNDVWFMDRYASVLGPHVGRARLVAYMPLDGCFADPSWARSLLAYDLVVVYTEWARGEVERAWDRLDVGVDDRPPTAVVPHGVDVDAFRPSRELLAADFDPAARAACKRDVFADADPPVDLLGETFIVLNASRLDERKRIDLTIEGFAAFARDKPPGVRLCLHHALGPTEQARELRARAEALGIEKRIVRNPLASRGAVLSDEALNVLYGACDVGINTSMGEGWGLVSFEHAAAGAPQVVPQHSACADLWKGHAILVPAETRYVPSFSVLQLAEVAPADVAVALDALYRDRREQQRLGRAAYEFVQRPEFRWETVAEKWADLLGGLLLSSRRNADA